MKEITAYISNAGIIFRNKEDALADDKKEELYNALNLIHGSALYPKEIVSLIMRKRKEILNILNSIDNEISFIMDSNKTY